MTDDGRDRMYSPAGDHREHPVQCQGRFACRLHTWAYDGICSRCRAEVLVTKDGAA